ncbi:hypothetical protein MTP06_34410 [Streptomyces sp. PLM4]|nr:hypothetical protein MTP06_34410 [Streptomyces sp. PLM4]
MVAREGAGFGGGGVVAVDAASEESFVVAVHGGRVAGGTDRAEGVLPEEGGPLLHISCTYAGGAGSCG